MGDVTTTNKVDSLEDESPFKKRKTSKKERFEQDIPTAQISEKSPEDESPPKKKKKSKKEKHHQEPEAGPISYCSDRTVQQSGKQLSHDETNGVGGGETFHTEVTKK